MQLPVVLLFRHQPAWLYYSDVILFWLWLATSLAVVVLFWKKIIAKLFLFGMVLVLIGSIIPMAIPFTAFVLSMTAFGLNIDKDSNEKYRAQIVGYSAMTPPRLEVIARKGLFEQRIISFTDSELLDHDFDQKIRSAKDMIFHSETDSTLTLTLFYGEPNMTITFDKSTGTAESLSKK